MATMTLIPAKPTMVPPARPIHLNPPLKWAGGKRWLLPILRRLWEPYSHLTLLEPFVGGMAVGLGLNPTAAILNDINQHLINFYRWLQKGLIVNFPLENNAEIYYRYRERFNTLIKHDLSHTSEAAILFYYLNRTGYNGLCRFNKKGFFNVPFGRYKTINYIKDFSSYTSSLKSWKLINRDFNQIYPKPDTFIYADPPYDVEFTSYSPRGFNWNDQVQLAQWLAAHTGPVVASNQATPRIIDLYTSLGFEIQIINAPRRIACNGDRRDAAELFAMKGVNHLFLEDIFNTKEKNGKFRIISRN